MLRNSRMANAISFEELTIDERVFCVNMENPGAEFVNVQDGIDELAKQMARVPFNPEVFTFAFVEETFPHRRLREHVVAHDREVVRAHGTMFERNPDAFVDGGFGDRFPKLEKSGQKLLEWFVNRVVAFRMLFELDHSAGKAGDRFHANPSSDLDGVKKHRARVVGLPRVQRVFVKSAYGGYADVTLAGSSSEVISKTLPVL